LLGASDSLATLAIAFLLLVGAIAFLAALVVRISMVILERNHRASLGNLHVDILALLALSLEGFLYLGDLLLLKSLREGDFECNEQVAKFIGLLMVGHAMSLNSLDFIRLNYLTGLVLYSDLTAIKVSQHEIDTSERLEKRYLFFHQKVSTTTLESIVGFFLHLNDYITGLNIREFISLAMEDVFLSVGSTFVDLDLEDLLILDNLLAIAIFALVFLIDDLTLAVAVIAWASTL